MSCSGGLGRRRWCLGLDFGSTYGKGALLDERGGLLHAFYGKRGRAEPGALAAQGPQTGLRIGLPRASSLIGNAAAAVNERIRRDFDHVPILTAVYSGGEDPARRLALEAFVSQVKAHRGRQLRVGALDASE